MDHLATYELVWRKITGYWKMLLWEKDNCQWKLWQIQLVTLPFSNHRFSSNYSALIKSKLTQLHLYSTIRILQTHNNKQFLKFLYGIIILNVLPFSGLWSNGGEREFSVLSCPYGNDEAKENMPWKNYIQVSIYSINNNR